MLVVEAYDCAHNWLHSELALDITDVPGMKHLMMHLVPGVDHFVVSSLTEFWGYVA